MPTARELLLRAADSVEKEPHRWIQDYMRATVSGERRACMLGLVCSGGSFDRNARVPALPGIISMALAMLRKRIGTDLA